MQVNFKKLHKDAQLPTQNQGDVGFDLYAIEDKRIYTGQVVKVRTGIAIAGYDPHIAILKAHASPNVDPNVIATRLMIYPKIESRSGMALEGVVTYGGIVDPIFRHELTVVLFNHAKHPKHEVKKGDRIAQLVFTACLATPDIQMVEVDEIEETDRGPGFGSSGQ